MTTKDMKVLKARIKEDLASMENLLLELKKKA